MWFQKKQHNELGLDSPQERRAKIEVVAHKEATKKQVAQVKEINHMLNKQFVENGFHIKIFLAAGGRKPKHRVG